MARVYINGVGIDADVRISLSRKSEKTVMWPEADVVLLSVSFEGNQKVEIHDDVHVQKDNRLYKGRVSNVVQTFSIDGSRTQLKVYDTVEIPIDTRPYNRVIQCRTDITPVNQWARHHPGVQAHYEGRPFDWLDEQVELRSSIPYRVLAGCTAAKILDDHRGDPVCYNRRPRPVQGKGNRWQKRLKALDNYLAFTRVISGQWLNE